MQCPYQAKYALPSEENIQTHSFHKECYKKRLPQRQSESWREFCSNNFKGDLFGSPKKIAGPSPNQYPPLIKINGAIACDSSQVLKAFSAVFFAKASPNSPSQNAIESEVSSVTSDSSFFTQILCSEVLSAIDLLKPNQSPGTDGCLVNKLFYFCPPTLLHRLSFPRFPGQVVLSR